MPILIMTPDMSAEILDGAAGCASGSQIWNGMMPALTPNPIVAQRKTIDWTAVGRRDPGSLNAPKLNEPVWEKRITNMTTRRAVPRCVMTT